MTAAKVPVHTLDTALDALIRAFADAATAIRAIPDDQAALSSAIQVCDVLKEVSTAASGLRTTIRVRVRSRLIDSAVCRKSAQAW
ncbi:hypothetical protein [Nonomuraea sp. 10N515B]|uniref:hypothetical protein n=1 Tax=Nonomuraea sp. 10N515B TaxID=3457422 RepID=UPI003FCEBED8